MRPEVWRPPVELTADERAVVGRMKQKSRLFVFLRTWRHELVDEAFQAELAAVYDGRGKPPAPPAQLALATILQAYTGLSDEDVIEEVTADRRWQLVLDCLDATQAPFGKGTLWRFRQLLMRADLDRRLVERTVAVAQQRGGFGARALRAALDASPLWGAGRVEDTYNLLGHAPRSAVSVLARQQGRGLAEIAADVGAPELSRSSLKAALGVDWDDPTARTAALARVLEMVTAVAAYVAEQADVPTGSRAAVAIAEQIQAQDVVRAADGTPTLGHGVARDRRISVTDGEMRHGRKSRTERVDGYKRHILRDLDSGLIHAVAVTAANAPESAATPALEADLDHQGCSIAELHIDRGYLASSLVRDRPPDRRIVGKPWPVHNADRFPKTAFAIDWDAQTLTCPAGITQPLVGPTVQFPAVTCGACALRDQCTTSAHGRSVAIHPDERLLTELRALQRSPDGRQRLRERVAVEHGLAHVGRWQGRRARYRGLRKNLFDLRRAAVVHNLFLIARRYPASPAA
jgi:IS5 family transposase